jgi:hypothetical protein
MARFLIEKHGISKFRGRREDSKVASVGYSPAARKWFGWSHRAIAGFGIGDRIFEASFGDDRTPFDQHGAVPITTLHEALIAATRFAEFVN